MLHNDANADGDTQSKGVSSQGRALDCPDYPRSNCFSVMCVCLGQQQTEFVSSKTSKNVAVPQLPHDHPHHVLQSRVACRVPMPVVIALNRSRSNTSRLKSS